MCMGSAVCRVAGVLAYRMGQENVMGRQESGATQIGSAQRAGGCGRFCV